MHSFIDIIKKYTRFKGTASRKEFWVFFAFFIIVCIVSEPIIRNILPYPISKKIYTIFLILFTIPLIATIIRRLRDTYSSLFNILLIIPHFLMLFLFSDLAKNITREYLLLIAFLFYPILFFVIINTIIMFFILIEKGGKKNNYFNPFNNETNQKDKSI